LRADPPPRGHSEKPLGDARRPPLSFEDRGLLNHWGLSLEPQAPDGPVTMTIGGKAVMGVARGRLSAGSDACRLRDEALVADCRIGKGRVTVVADADWLDLGPDGIDGPIDGNIPALLAEIDALAR